MRRRGAPRRRDEPLRRERHETFVREYMTDFDGETAARRAGYSPAVAKRIWRILLGSPQIAKRMRQVKWGGAVPNLEKSAVLRALAEEAFSDNSDLWSTNPFTGQRHLVLTRASAEQMRQVAWKTKTVTRGGVTIVTQEAALLPGRAHLGVLSAALGMRSGGGTDGNLEGQMDDDMVERIARIRRALSEDDD